MKKPLYIFLTLLAFAVSNTAANAGEGCGSNGNIFCMNLRYYDPDKPSVTPSYTGNITQAQYGYEYDMPYTYTFAYDHLNRFVESKFYYHQDNTPYNVYTEQVLGYDPRGNIMELVRFGENNAICKDNIFYSYSGNQLTNAYVISNGIGASVTYTYDANGSMTHDGRRGFDVEYNLIDLVYKVTESSSNIVKATYTYLADGTKLAVIDNLNNGFDYLGSFVYKRESSALTLESTPFAGGRILKTNSGYDINYYITDHLGSTRVVASSTGVIIDMINYYPFGMRWEGPSLPAPQTRYLFNGKEKQTVGGVNYMDFGSRMYDDFMCRWFTHDPQSYKRPWDSPYLYCGGNPVGRIDPNGEFFFAAVGIGALLNAVCWGAAIGAATYTASVAMSPVGFNNWNAGQFWKSVGFGAVSGAATFGIGSYFQGLPQGFGTELARAYTHGWANGAISHLSGGNFMQGFLSGGLSSLAGYGASQLGITNTTLGVYAFSGLAGGIGAELTGGNFWQGAGIGVMVTGLNQLQHAIKYHFFEKSEEAFSFMEEYTKTKNKEIAGTTAECDGKQGILVCDHPKNTREESYLQTEKNKTGTRRVVYRTKKYTVTQDDHYHTHSSQNQMIEPSGKDINLYTSHEWRNVYVLYNRQVYRMTYYNNNSGTEFYYYAKTNITY